MTANLHKFTWGKKTKIRNTSNLRISHDIIVIIYVCSWTWEIYRWKLRRQGYASVLIPFSKLVKVTVMLTVSKVRTWVYVRCQRVGCYYVHKTDKNCLVRSFTLRDYTNVELGDKRKCIEARGHQLYWVYNIELLQTTLQIRSWG